MTKRFGFTLAGATHVDMQQKTVKNAFTLAEVLITLGIIGVVAAMTMPTLMNSTQGAQYKAAYKKALSALSQAVTLNAALDEWNFAGADAATYKIEDMLSNRMNVVRTEAGEFTGVKTGNYTVSGDSNGLKATVDPDADSALSMANNYTLFFNDGIMFTFPKTSKNCTIDETLGGKDRDKICKGFIDVNGVKAPNKFVKCDNTDATRGSGTTSEKCEIKNPTDVYPVMFYDQTVLPNSPAARAVLYSK